MYRPVNQRVPILVGIAILNTLIFYWASGFHNPNFTRGYELKLEAANLMDQAMEVITDYQKNRNDFEFDIEDDPFESGIIGPATTLITTSLANLRSKQTSVNPNLAALVVDLLMEANLSKGDTIAVGYTGSFPAVNLAVLSACEVMKIHPVIIASVGSSRWGATDPEFTWLDIEALLNKSGLISTISNAASLGGRADRGKGLKSEGRDLLWETIYRNNIQLIEAPRLSQSIEKKVEYYNAILPISHYKAYLNVGGGASSIGQSVNARLIPNGVSTFSEVGELIGPSVVKSFVENETSIIHIYSIIDLAIKHQLPVYPEELHPIGVGPLYFEMRYNLKTTSLALTFTLGLIITVSIITHNQIKVRMSTHDPESLL